MVELFTIAKLFKIVIDRRYDDRWMIISKIKIACSQFLRVQQSILLYFCDLIRNDNLLIDKMLNLFNATSTRDLCPADKVDFITKFGDNDNQLLKRILKEYNYSDLKKIIKIFNPRFNRIEYQDDNVPEDELEILRTQIFTHISKTKSTEDKKAPRDTPTFLILDD